MKYYYYFSYATNTNPTSWTDWCRKIGYSVEESPHERTFQKIDNAFLPDWMLEYIREGETENVVLGISPAFGCTAPGVLYRVDENGLKKLETRAQLGNVFEKVDVLVQTGSGYHKAFTFASCEKNRSPKPLKPDKDYVRTITDGFSFNGLSDIPVRMTPQWKERMRSPLLFVYDSMRKGGILQEQLADFVRKPAKVKGQMYLINKYPGLCLNPNGNNVLGELVSVDRETIRRLDRLQGFYGYSSEKSLFFRYWLSMEEWGHDFGAWVYILARPEKDMQAMPKITSGDWLNK